jgi:uncharacterized membrane protein required for colicin V production
VDFLAHMTALDLLLIVLWGCTVVWGLLTGVIRQALVLGALLAGMVFAAVLTPVTGSFVGAVVGMGPAAVRPAVYTFVFVATSVVIYAASLRSYPYTRLVRFPAADSVGGGFVGFATGLLGTSELVAILGLLTSEPWAILDGARAAVSLQLETTPFLPWMVGTFPHIAAAVDRLIPT